LFGICFDFFQKYLHDFFPTKILASGKLLEYTEDDANGRRELTGGQAEFIKKGITNN
jgi:hypothetical protein